MTGTLGENIPNHVAIIMDGNGRWAEARGKDRSEGHRAGAEPVRTVLKAAHNLGIRYLTLYTFSTENWFRSSSEVKNLFSLIIKYLDSETQELLSSGVKLLAVGDLKRLPPETLEPLYDAMAITKKNTGITLTLALSYGGRAELVAAAKSLSEKISQGALSLEDINENTFFSELWTSELPEVDLLIRTGGDKRISNYLLWHIAYAELHFTDTLWPDFGKEDLIKAVLDYQRRERRFGRA
jgi:undecaprenyl diphosphate synthase